MRAARLSAVLLAVIAASAAAQPQVLPEDAPTTVRMLRPACAGCAALAPFPKPELGEWALEVAPVSVELAARIRRAERRHHEAMAMMWGLSASAVVVGIGGASSHAPGCPYRRCLEDTTRPTFIASTAAALALSGVLLYQVLAPSQEELVTLLNEWHLLAPGRRRRIDLRREIEVRTAPESSEAAPAAAESESRGGSAIQLPSPAAGDPRGDEAEGAGPGGVEATEEAADPP